MGHKMASLLCPRLALTFLVAVLALPLSCANEDGCSYSYDEVPKSPMNCNPLGVNITFSCFFTVPRDPPTAVRWYYSKQEGECGRWINETTDEFELNVRKIGLTGPPRIFYQHTFIIHNFSSNHNGNYWCQMVTNETVLLDPSQVAHVAVNSNLMNCTTIQRQVVTDGICAQVIVNSTCRIPGSTELQITSSFDLVTPTTVMPTPLTASESAMVTSNLGSSTSDGVFVTITSSTDDLPKSITSVPQSLTMPSSHPNIISAPSSSFLSETVTHSTVTATIPVVFTDPSSSLKPSLVPSPLFSTALSHTTFTIATSSNLSEAVTHSTVTAMTPVISTSPSSSPKSSLTPSPLLSTALPHITLTTGSGFSETVTHSTVIAMTPVMFTDLLDLSQSPKPTPSPPKPKEGFLAKNYLYIAIGGGAFVGGVCFTLTGCCCLFICMRRKRKRNAYSITSSSTTKNYTTEFQRNPSTAPLDLTTLNYCKPITVGGVTISVVTEDETEHDYDDIESDQENSPGITNKERCSSKMHPTMKETERKTSEGKLSVYHPQLSTHSLTSSPKASISLSSLTYPFNVDKIGEAGGKKTSQSLSTQVEYACPVVPRTDKHVYDPVSISTDEYSVPFDTLHPGSSVIKIHPKALSSNDHIRASSATRFHSRDQEGSRKGSQGGPKVLPKSGTKSSVLLEPVYTEPTRPVQKSMRTCKTEPIGWKQMQHYYHSLELLSRTGDLEETPPSAQRGDTHQYHILEPPKSLLTGRSQSCEWDTREGEIKPKQEHVYHTLEEAHPNAHSASSANWPSEAHTRDYHAPNQQVGAIDVAAEGLVIKRV